MMEFFGNHFEYTCMHVQANVSHVTMQFTNHKITPVTTYSLVLPDLLRTGAYQLEIISAVLEHGAYNL